MDLEIADGEFFTMLGPSGCGKTTTLRMIAGFEQPTEGKVLIDGADVAGLPAYKRPTNTVFQSYALFPHMNLDENVGFGLKRKKVDKAEIKKRVAAELERVGLSARGQAQADPALRRPAAASRARPGPGQPAEGAAARRAARRPRPQAAQGPAGPAQADPARRRDHLRLRDPRPGRGADDVRPDRGHERRPDRAVRRSRGRLRATGDHLRRRLHRRLEPDARCRHRARTRSSSTAAPTVPTPDAARLLDRRALLRRGPAREAERRDLRRRGPDRPARQSTGSSRARSTSAPRPR